MTIESMKNIPNGYLYVKPFGIGRVILDQLKDLGIPASALDCQQARSKCRPDECCVTSADAHGEPNHGLETNSGQHRRQAVPSKSPDQRNHQSKSLEKVLSSSGSELGYSRRTIHKSLGSIRWVARLCSWISVECRKISLENSVLVPGKWISV